MKQMYFTYIIRSIPHPTKTYVGYTKDIEQRLKKHNQHTSTYTRRYAPWEIVFYCAFPDKSTAMSFEQYPKSGSGKAFSKKHF